MTTSVKEEVKQELPEKIFAVNYAGYWEIQDGVFYGDIKLLDEDEYQHAEKMAEETCNRYNSYPELKKQNHELLEALKEAKLQIEYLHQKFTATGSGNAVLAQIENVISKSNINEQ